MNKHGHFETYSNPITPSRHFPTVMKEINPAEDTESSTWTSRSIRARGPPPGRRPGRASP